MAWKFFTAAGALKNTQISGSGYGTSLPASPSDGMEYTLVDSLTVPTYQWRFRYNAGSSNTDKWEYVGGTPGSADGTNVTTTSTTYANLSTDIAFTVPRAGVYRVQTAVTHQAQNGGQVETVATKFGAAATADTNSGNPALLSNRGNGSRSFTAVALSASDVVRVQAKTSAGTLTCSPGLIITPVRVS